MGYLVDSNVLIDYVAQRFTPAQLKILDTIFDQSLAFSVITKIEVLGLNSEIEEQKQMITFVEYADVVPLDDAIVTQTIALKNQLR